jgi:hypothetical protein
LPKSAALIRSTSDNKPLQVISYRFEVLTWAFGVWKTAIAGPLFVDHAVSQLRTYHLKLIT